MALDALAEGEITPEQKNDPRAMRDAIRSDTHPDSRLSIRVARESDKKIVGPIETLFAGSETNQFTERSEGAKSLLFIQSRGRSR